MHAQRQAQRQQDEQAQAQQGQPSEEQAKSAQKLQANDQLHQQNMAHTQDMHDLKMKLAADEGEQRRRQQDLNEAVRTSGLIAQQRVKTETATKK
jgi:hypothetical protein